VPRRLLALAWLLTVETGCPDTWGKEGYVQKAFHENLVRESLREDSSCRLSQEEWRRRCAAPNDAAGTCPAECPRAGAPGDAE